MPACPECEPIAQARYEAGVRQQQLRDQINPLRAELERGLQPPADALQMAITARMQVEAEHAALVQAVAEMTAEVAKMTGSGAFAVAGFNPADVSRQEQPGWIRAEIGPTTLWFRTADAQEAYMRASGLAAALDSLARLTAEREAALTRVRDANARESDAQDALWRAEERANERLQQHHDLIEAANAEWHRLDAEHSACIARCQHGEVEDQRIGMVGLALMMVGLTLVILGNPFGIGTGSAQVADGGTTGVIGGATSTSTATPAPTVVARIGPIRAVFSPPQQATTYTLPVEMEGTVPGIDWRGADCGAFQVTTPTSWRWNHPHPPCDPTTDHRDRTIVATIQIGQALIECRYQGSATGTGTPCTGPGGTTVTPAGAATPGTTSTATPSATSTAAGGGGSAPGSTSTATPSATASAASGGGTQARTPTPTATATPTVSEGADGGGGGSTAATLAGTALTVAGGAAAGYATSRRRDGTQTRDGEDEGDEGDEPTGEQPETPLTQPRITVSGGATTVTEDRPFTITVETPRPSSGDPPATIDVTMRSVETGEEETVTLRWNGGTSGPVKYESNPLTLERGGTGGGKRTIAGFEFSTGDMGNDLKGTPNGTDIVISTGGSETRVTAYTTWVQEGIGQHMSAIRQYGEFWRNVAIQLSALPDGTEGKAELLSQARTALRLAAEANRIESVDWLDTKKLAYVRTIFGLLQGGVTHDPRDEYQYFASAEESGRRMSEESLWRGMAGATIGLYRTISEVSGAGAAYTLFTGRDIMDQKVHWSERVFAALDLAGRLTLYGGTRMALGSALDRAAMGEVRVVATEVRAATNAAEAEARAAEAAKDAAASTAFAERQAAARRIRTLIPDVPNPTGVSGRGLLRAPAGTVVEFTEDFGMLRNRARHFQSVAERYGVRIRVRGANLESLESMARGNPPKHVKLKSKTINELDEVLGAPPNSQGLVGYFDPRTVARSGQMEADYARVLGRTPDASDWAALEKRAGQRASEFRDQAKAMEHLEHDGLVRVDNGVVVDTGLSNTRLKDGELVRAGGPDGGTGRAFTGDHDMWDITRPDGSPVDAATKARIEANLMDGSARTQHGPHKDWVPTTDVDRGIDAKIRASHQGAVNPDGSITPARSEFTKPGATTPEVVNGEGLIEFSPGERPRVSYETGDRG